MLCYVMLVEFSRTTTTNTDQKSSARARTAAAADASQAGNRFSALGAVHEQQVLEEGEIAAAEAAAAEALQAAAAEPLPEDDDELMPPAEFVHPHNNLIAGPD